jgi:hypothetical protein
MKEIFVFPTPDYIISPEIELLKEELKNNVRFVEAIPKSHRSTILIVPPQLGNPDTNDNEYVSATFMNWLNSGPKSFNHQLKPVIYLGNTGKPLFNERQFIKENNWFKYRANYWIPEDTFNPAEVGYLILSILDGEETFR